MTQLVRTRAFAAPALTLLLAACVAAAGCATLARSGARSGPGDWPLPDPLRAPFVGQIEQDVELGLPGGSTHLLAVLEKKKDGVLLVGFSPLGQRLLWLYWTRAGVKADIAPGVAPYLDQNGLLRELAFALWPETALQDAFKGGAYRADFGAHRRVLWRGAAERLVVDYPAGIGGSMLELRLPGEGAGITIRTLPAGTEP